MYDAHPMRALRVLAAGAAATVAFTGSSAWTAPTRVRMTDDAVLFLPPALRSVIAQRHDPLLRGMLEPMTREDDPAHRPRRSGGTLESSIDSAFRDLVKAVDSHQPFGEIARRFGILAHFVADAGFPPGSGGPDGDRRYAHFAAFCESRRPKFPLVFYGHDSPALARGDVTGFAAAIVERARAQDSDLARAYAQAPSWDDPASFDDRSIPFAIASLSYSRAVTDVAQAWVAAWRACHGDLAGTPYLAPSTTKGTAR